MANANLVAKSGTPSLATITPDHSCQVGSGLLAGEAIAAGDVCYIHSGGTVKRTVDSATPGDLVVALGMAARAADIGTPVTLYRNVEFHYGTGLTPGAPLYACDDPAGGLVDVAPALTLTSQAGDALVWTAPAVAYCVDATRVRFIGTSYIVPEYTPNS